MAATIRAGIDVGGTFTDAVLLDDASWLTVTKVRTTPADLAEGFLKAAAETFGPGAPARAAIIRECREERIPGKGYLRIRRGETVVFVGAGGGAFGPP